MSWLSLLTAGATAAGQIYSAKSAQEGQQQANQGTMAFNALEAQKQRDWEEGMFNTRYQRSRRDLEAAGYNPLLALIGPGSVPSGAAAHAELKSETSESSHYTSEAVGKMSQAALDALLRRKIRAEATSAESQARIDAQMADMTTSKPGKLLSWVRMIMGSGAVQTGSSILGGIAGLNRAKQIADAISRQPRITMKVRGKS